MGRTARAALSLALLLLAAGAPRAAHAQTDADRETARVLYKEGNDARDAGDMAAAAGKYQVAYALVPTPVIGVAHGKAEMALGHLVEAREAFLRAEALPTKSGESPLTLAARADAEALARELLPRIPSVQLHRPAGSPAVRVTVDGVLVPDVAVEAPRRLNPGAHLLVVATDDGSMETRFTLAEREAKDLPLALPVPAVVKPLDVTPQPLPPPPPVLATRPASRPSRAPAYAAFGAGGAGFVVELVFGVLMLNEQASLERACGPSGRACPSGTNVDAARDLGHVSDVGLGVGVAGLAVGGGLLLFRRGDAAPTSAPTSAQVMPWIGAGSIGVRGSFL